MFRFDEMFCDMAPCIPTFTPNCPYNMNAEVFAIYLVEWAHLSYFTNYWWFIISLLFIVCNGYINMWYGILTPFPTSDSAFSLMAENTFLIAKKNLVICLNSLSYSQWNMSLIAGLRYLTGCIPYIFNFLDRLSCP